MLLQDHVGPVGWPQSQPPHPGSKLLRPVILLQSLEWQRKHLGAGQDGTVLSVLSAATPRSVPLTPCSLFPASPRLRPVLQAQRQTLFSEEQIFFNILNSLEIYILLKRPRKEQPGSRVLLGGVRGPEHKVRERFCVWSPGTVLLGLALWATSFCAVSSWPWMGFWSHTVGEGGSPALTSTRRLSA